MTFQHMSEFKDVQRRSMIEVMSVLRRKPGTWLQMERARATNACHCQEQSCEAGDTGQLLGS